MRVIDARTTNAAVVAEYGGPEVVALRQWQLPELGGTRDLGKIAKTAARIVAVLGRNLLPGGKRTKVYSIQRLAPKHPDWYRQDLTALFDMLAAGEIKPAFAAVWKLDEVPAALEALAGGSLLGKQVIDVAHS